MFINSDKYINIMNKKPKPVKIYNVRIYDDDQDIIEKIEKFKKLFGELTESKTIKKMIRELEIK